MKKRLVLLTVLALITLLFTVPISAKENYGIPAAATAPVIDGAISADEWNGALKIDVSNDAVGWILAQADGMNIGAGSYVAFMWDATNLYCAANIIDGTYGTQPASGGALNMGDGIQLCFFATGEAANGDGTVNMFWDFLPRTGSGDASTAETYEHFTFAATTDLQIKSTINSNGNYTMEWAIPWSLFASAHDKGYESLYTGAAGTEMIMEITVMDQDGDATQALGYSTDEWCVSASTDVYTLTADQAGIIPVVETEAPVTEVPAAAPEVTAVQTSDAAFAVSIISIAAAAALVLLRRK